jgi:hypothetical protein
LAKPLARTIDRRADRHELSEQSKRVDEPFPSSLEDSSFLVSQKQKNQAKTIKMTDSRQRTEAFGVQHFWRRAVGRKKTN